MKTVTIPQAINNEDALYAGKDLRHYFRIIFFNAQNIFHPYHNLRHMLHVFWMCYQACVFYEDTLKPRQIRNILIAALFHDYDHSGMSGNDDLNIARAIRGLEKHLLEEDKNSFAEISDIIRATEFPYVIPENELNLSQQIIRDADIVQVFSVAWIQQVILGLAKEWNKPTMDILKIQEGFLSKIKFSTTWAKELFPKEIIDEKIKESLEILAILNAESS
jgi:hypothetical protein